jgi:tol-pal system protein YbgF
MMASIRIGRFPHAVRQPAALAAALLLAVALTGRPADLAAAPGHDGAALPATLAAARGDLADLRDALEATRAEARDLATLQLAQLPQNYAAQVEVRLTELERRLQELTGQVEQLSYRISQSESRLERALNDIEYRLTTLEGGEPPAPSTDGAATAPAPPETTYIGPEDPDGGGAADGGTADGSGPQPETGVLGTLIIEGEDGVPRNPSPIPPRDDAADGAGAQTAALPSGSVEAQYDYAYGLLQGGDFAAAEGALAEFLRRHGDHALASNAHYWLGETYYVRSRFEDAASAFARGYRAFPEGAKAVDSLLKLGMSLAQLGRTEDACLTFDRLSSEFPNGPVAVQRRAAQERERLQCN